MDDPFGLQAQLDDLARDLLSLPQAADHLQISLATLRNLIEQRGWQVFALHSTEFILYGKVEQYRRQRSLKEGDMMAVQYKENQFQGINPILQTILQTKGMGDTHKSFHSAHISHIADLLNDRLLPRGYRAITEDSLEIGKKLYQPDVLLDFPNLELPIGFNPPTHPENLLPVAEPSFIVVMDMPEMSESVVIYAGEPGEKAIPVTVIELLSPSNLDTNGRVIYLNKRVNILNHGINLVEIHYLNQHPPVLQHLPDYPDDPMGIPYHIAVTYPQEQDEQGRYISQIYAIRVNTRLPIIRIPLLSSDTVPFDFDDAYQQTYLKRGMGYVVDYGDLPANLNKGFSQADYEAIVKRAKVVQETYQKLHPQS